MTICWTGIREIDARSGAVAGRRAVVIRRCGRCQTAIETGGDRASSDQTLRSGRVDHAASNVGHVGAQAMDAELDQLRHSVGVVDRPDVDLEAMSGGRLHQ